MHQEELDALASKVAMALGEVDAIEFLAREVGRWEEPCPAHVAALAAVARLAEVAEEVLRAAVQDLHAVARAQPLHS